MKYLIFSALLGLTTTSFAQKLHPDTLSKHVHYLASEELQGRALGTEGKEKAATYIIEQFKYAGLLPFQKQYKQDFDLKFDLAWVKASNIIGMVEGTNPSLKNEYIVLGAHYDHLGPKQDKSTYYPGADDNASGVATIIELAKYFNQYKPQRSIIFIAFDAEESGLIGSAHFVEQLDKNTRSQIKAMFSFDMVGMLYANKGLNLKGIANIKDGKQIASKFAKDITLLDTSNGIEERTDTRPFGDVGIPAVHVYTGAKSPYHKPEDKADLLDYSGMSTVACFTANLVTELANLPQIEAIKSMEQVQTNPNRIRKPFSLGISGYLGQGKHLYKDEFYDAKSEVSTGIGFLANYKLTKRWAINVEALYDENTSASANGKFKRQSILVPFNIEFGNLFYIATGGYFKHHLSGKDGDQTLDFDQLYRSQEWGYNVGAGFKYSHYRIGWTSRRSLQSIYQDGNKIIPTASYFHLGYSF